MSKRRERREQQRRKKSHNRLLVISFVIAGALIVSLFLILPGLKALNPNNIIPITPRASGIPMKGTSMGNSNAPVKVDVWEDFQCSGCLAYTENLEPSIIQNYVATGKVYYTFHLYPFIGGGEGESHDAANAAMCAAAQDRFWEYHDITFANWIGENMGSFTKPRLTAFAKNIGLDMALFDKCFQENAYSAQIQQDMAAGSKLGVPPTPGIFVDGKIVVSSAGKNYLPSFDDVSRAIEESLNGK